MDLVCLGEDGGDEGCLLECLVIFDVDLVPLEGDVGDGPLCLDVDLALLEEDAGGDPLCLDIDLVLLVEGAGDDPLCLFEGPGEWLH